MPGFTDFLTALKDGLLTLGKEQLQDHLEELIKDGNDFAMEAEKDLYEWTEQLASGEMSEDGFKMAVAGRLELAQMAALKQAGLTAIHIDRVKNGIVDTVLVAANKTIL